MTARAESRRLSGRPLLSLITFAVLAIIVLAIAYYGTAVYNFFVPTVLQKKDFSLGVWTLAVIGGVAGFLSPCAFGMLPYYFAFHLSATSSTANRSEVLSQSLRYGAAAALGMIVFAIGLAILILALGATFAPSLRIVTPVPNFVTQVIRVVCGLLLIYLGLQQLRGRSVIQTLGGLFSRAESRASSFMATERPSLLAFFVFGLLYVVVAMPCIANVMAGPLLAATALHGMTGAIVAVGLFLGTMALLMLAASVCFGLANRTIIERIESVRGTILKIAGAIMVLLGLVIIYFDLNTTTFRQIFFHFPIT